MINRRAFLAGGLVLLSGCNQAKSIVTQEEDHTLSDLWIGNSHEQPVVVMVEFQQEGEPEPTLSLTVRIPSKEKILWDDSKIFDDPGQVRADLPNEDIEPAEASWNGDNDIDNRGIEINIDTDELKILTQVA